MLARIGSLIEEKAEALASEWLTELERRNNVLAAADNRRELWNDAKTWVTLLLRALRTDDISPLQRASRLLARRLAVGGFPAADAVEAIIAFKSVLWHQVTALPASVRKTLINEGQVLDQWFDTVVLNMVEHYGALQQGDGSRSAVVDRAKHLSRLAEEESAISHLAQEMASERDAARLLELLARSAAHLVGAKKAAVVVPRGDSLRYGGAYRLPLSDLSRYIARVGEPVSGPLEDPETARIISDLADGSNDVRADAARKLDISTALRVPMQVGGRSVALLELFDPLTEQAWTDHDMELVQELAAQGALAIENARLLAATELRAQELSALYETGRELAIHFRSPHLFDVALSRTAQVLHGQLALLWLRIPGTAHFALRATHGRLTGGTELDFDLGKGQLGKLAAGAAVIISPAASRELPWGRGGAMIAPLRVGPRLLGLLAVRRKQAGFDEDDLRLLEALADKIVVALENARLYRESIRLGERLNASIAALGEALAAALDMQELLHVIAEKAAELADAAVSIIFLEDEAGRLAVQALAVRGDESGVAADPRVYEQLAKLAVESREPIYLACQDQRLDERLRRVMRTEQVRAVAAFPLTIRGEVGGALCILKHAVALRPQERKLLASFCRQAAVGIENVILFGETQQRLAELADLSRASARVSATLDQTAIAEIIVESVSRALRVPVAATALVGPDHEFYLPEGGHRGLPASFVRRFAVRPGSIAFSVVEDQRFKVIGDVAAEGRGQDSLIEGLGVASLICAPLKGREGVLGVLFAADRMPRTFRPHEEALLSAYANEAALALQNALHHRAVAVHARELEGILDATKTLSSTLELQPVLDHLASAAASLLGVPVCSIMLLDSAGTGLRTVASCGLSPDHKLHTELRAGEGIAGMVAVQGTPVSSTDLLRDGRFKRRDVARAEGLRSMLSVPLTSKGKTIGVVNAYSRSDRPFTAAQERLLTTLAGEASVAIENAHLYAEAREQTRAMRSLMEEVNHRIKNNIQSTIGIIQLHMAQVEDPKVLDALREIIARVQAISVVQEMLFDEDMRAIDVKEISRRILDNALRANPNPKLKLTGQVGGARVRLPSRKATPLASVVNELVYNSVTHAFNSREQGTIAISLQEATGGQILVQVSDDGVGLPADFRLERDARLGLRIVEGLVSQDLGGEFTIASNGGTIARVTFER
jgi:GAF domain-containing protein